MVRISLGAYNNMAGVDRAVRALEWLVVGEVLGTYRMLGDGTFVPRATTSPCCSTSGPTPWGQPPGVGPAR
jgi:hypothetical protein